MLEGFVRIKSKRICHRHMLGKIGEIFGYRENYYTGTVIYGVSYNGKDYEFYEHELEEIKNI